MSMLTNENFIYFSSIMWEKLFTLFTLLYLLYLLMNLNPKVTENVFFLLMSLYPQVTHYSEFAENTYYLLQYIHL